MNHIIPLEKTGCVILSGGTSSRMHTHKALLSYNAHENFLQHIIHVYNKAGIKNIAVVKNAVIGFDGKITKYPVRLVTNNNPELGRLYSIQVGLSAISGIQYCFIQNIDNPFVTGQLLHSLYSVRNHADYISPSYNNQGGHPVLISHSIINEIATVKDYTPALRDMLSRFSRHRLPVNDKLCLCNINEPADYDKIFPGKNKMEGMQ